MEQEKYSGKVVWFNNKDGFGFIEWSVKNAKQTDMFVHFSDIMQEGFRSLKSGDKVVFSIGKNYFGKDKAIEVIVVS